jgi:hypothetical protein
VKPELTALAKAEEAAQQLARRRHQPIPLTIFYIGSTFYGGPDSWKQGVDRLARSSILIVLRIPTKATTRRSEATSGGSC